MITNHQYLSKHPIDKEAKKLILGTIHPHNHENFLMDFFYGNELSIWKIFNRAFPQQLKDPSDLKSVLKFLKTKRLALSDTIMSCERSSPTALDNHLIPIELNRVSLLEQIKNSKISEILCTSGFDKNNAFRIFYCDILGLKLTSAIRKDKQIILPPSIFGRPIMVKFIYSPSRRALTGISGSKAYKAVKDVISVDDFRVNIYREAFAN